MSAVRVRWFPEIARCCGTESPTRRRTRPTRSNMQSGRSTQFAIARTRATVAVERFSSLRRARPRPLVHDLLASRSCVRNDRWSATRHDRSALRQRCWSALAYRWPRRLGFSSAASGRVVNRHFRSQHNGNLKLPFSLFLALRYLKPKRTFLSIITLISIIGVTLGVTVLILVISVMTGFDRELRQKIIDFDAHILVKSEDVMRDWRTLQKKIDNTPHVVASAPFVQGPVIVEFQNQRLAPVIRGIDPTQEERVIPIRKFIKEGQLDLDGESAVLGSDLARILRIRVGDKLTVYSPGNLGQILDEIKNLENAKGADEKKALEKLREVVLPKDLTVTGIFETGRYQYDSEFVLVPIYIGQELYNLGDALHGVTVRTDDPYAADRVKESFEQFLEPPVFAQTWTEMNHQFFEAIRLERNVMFFLLLFIVIVAAFGIMSTLITVTVQKRREIGIVKALGANISQIIWVFLGQGTVVGFFGTLTGLGLGMTLIRYRNGVAHWLASTLHIEIFPREVYQFSEIPAQVIPYDVTIICISAFLICSFAALIPAYFAARLDPVKALRYE
ncbi:MAG: ABC transporter permease [Verrucomicrobia bacterium]|nr:MAG: ABC transporter permease [Verrucomicrobiota bacterium]